MAADLTHHAGMDRERVWRAAYYALLAVFVATAALNMMQVRAGFFTNHAADLVVPAWLYLVMRGRAPGERLGAVARVVGRSPAVAAATLFLASTATEVSQLVWPRGVFSGTFDPLDIVAFAAGLGVCYIVDSRFPRRGE